MTKIVNRSENIKQIAQQTARERDEAYQNISVLRDEIRSLSQENASLHTLTDEIPRYEKDEQRLQDRIQYLESELKTAQTEIANIRPYIRKYKELLNQYTEASQTVADLALELAEQKRQRDAFRESVRGRFAEIMEQL